MATTANHIPTKGKKTYFEKAQDIVRSYFGYDSIQDDQKEAIVELMRGNDVLCVMPTGSGKSLCYQAPAIAARFEKTSSLRGITIVIEPIRALMENQADDFNKIIKKHGHNARAVAVHYDNAEKAYQIIRRHRDQICLLYVSPERLANPKFREIIKKNFNWEIATIVVDEAHIASLWGHGFRPKYRQIRRFIATAKKNKSQVAVAAFTATATRFIGNDITKILSLNIKSPGGFTRFDHDVRSNLRLDVRLVKGGLKKNEITVYRNELEGILEQHRGELGIIYCNWVGECIAVYEYLKSKGYRVAKYHGSGSGTDMNMRDMELEHKEADRITPYPDHDIPQDAKTSDGSEGESEDDPEEKTRRELLEQEKAEAMRQFMNDEIDIMVATNAFGMGIDKKVDAYDEPDSGVSRARKHRDILFVIHHTMPATVEDYVQQIGRAGRHWKKEMCGCHLFYHPSHFKKHLAIAEKQSNEYRRSERDMLVEMAKYRIMFMNVLILRAKETRKHHIIQQKWIKNYFDHFEAWIRKTNPDILKEAYHENLPAELHVGSTMLYQTFRKPDKKKTDVVTTLREADPKTGNRKKLRDDYYVFRDEMPDYFDMMVMDALYTLFRHAKEREHYHREGYVFTPLRILQMLAGSPYVDHKSPLIGKIGESLQKLQRMEVHIGKKKADEITYMPMLPISGPMRSPGRTRGKSSANAYLLPDDYVDCSPAFEHLDTQFRSFYIKHLDTANLMGKMPRGFTNITEESLKLQHYILYRLTVLDADYMKRLYSVRYTKDKRKKMVQSLNPTINLKYMLEATGITGPVVTDSKTHRKENNHRNMWEMQLTAKLDAYFAFLKERGKIHTYEFLKHAEGTHSQNQKSARLKYRRVVDEETGKKETVQVDYIKVILRGYGG